MDNNVMVINATLTEMGSIASQVSASSTEIPAEIKEGGGTSDYNKLANKPSINGTTLIGNYDEIDPTVPQWAKDDEPEEMTTTHVEFLWRSIFGN